MPTTAAGRRSVDNHQLLLYTRRMLARYDITIVPVIRSTEDWAEILRTGTGETLFVHSALRCPALKNDGVFCCIHRPSDHHMRTWQMAWFEEYHFMVRLCVHGNGHIDPDDAAHRQLLWERERSRQLAVSPGVSLADRFDAERHHCACECCKEGTP